MRGPLRLKAALAASAVTGLLLVAASLALGRPDAAAAAEFLSTGRPTHSQAVATVGVIVWVMVVLLAVLQSLSVVTTLAGGVADQVRHQRTRARLALAIGVLVLFGGVIRHQATTGSLCCGDMARAEQLAP